MDIRGCFISEPIKNLIAISTLAACMLQTGCSTHTAHGELSTHDGGRLQLSGKEADQYLEPGSTSIDFELRPVFFSYLTLRNAKTEFSTRLYRQNYSHNAFTIARKDSDLKFDITGRWQEIRLKTYREEGRQSCVDHGYCTQTETWVYCSDEATRRVEAGSSLSKAERKKDCETHEVDVTDYYPDCPGSEPVERTFQDYRYDIQLKFHDPQAPAQERAHFEGKTAPMQRLIDTLPLGPCDTR
ncbi:MAG: hypothetical protein V4812_17795 [Pseudomonadota bacterium]